MLPVLIDLKREFCLWFACHKKAPQSDINLKYGSRALFSLYIVMFINLNNVFFAKLLFTYQKKNAVKCIASMTKTLFRCTCGTCNCALKIERKMLQKQNGIDPFLRRRKNGSIPFSWIVFDYRSLQLIAVWPWNWKENMRFGNEFSTHHKLNIIYFDTSS